MWAHNLLKYQVAATSTKASKDQHIIGIIQAVVKRLLLQLETWLQKALQ